MRLPKAVTFGEEVRDVTILRAAPRRIIVAADATWDDFFEAPGADLGERRQSRAERRETF